MTFTELGLSEPLFDAIDRLGFEEPTEIQREAIPAIMEGRDVMGESATGSGKTLAFGCGVIEHAKPGQGNQALILAPTRELAEQVRSMLGELTKDLHVTSIYGGVALDPQIDEIKRAEVVVATPGRLLDHVQRGNIDLSSITLLVLDEVDQMLDMGFIEDVERIMKQCNTDRQNLFFSATFGGKMRDLAKRFMQDPVKIMAERQVDPAKLRQVYYDVPKSLRVSLLVHLIKQDAGLAMVFCNTRRTVDFVTKNLRANKIDATAIHGGLSQNKRSRTLNTFNKADVEVLVCTDVAARGLHIDNVTHVYNFEIPKDPRDYVHRSGRTARAGEEGLVINLLADVDHANFQRVLSAYREMHIDRLERPYIERVKTVIPKDQQRRGNFRGRRPRGPRKHRRRR